MRSELHVDLREFPESTRLGCLLSEGKEVANLCWALTPCHAEEAPDEVSGVGATLPGLSRHDPPPQTLRRR